MRRRLPLGSPGLGLAGTGGLVVGWSGAAVPFDDAVGAVPDDEEVRTPCRQGHRDVGGYLPWAIISRISAPVAALNSASHPSLSEPAPVTQTWLPSAAIPPPLPLLFLRAC
jgi:hypothetical protein